MIFYFQPYHIHVFLLNIKIPPSAYFSLLKNLFLTPCHEFSTLVWLISLPNPVCFIFIIIHISL